MALLIFLSGFLIEIIFKYLIANIMFIIVLIYTEVVIMLTNYYSEGSEFSMI